MNNILLLIFSRRGTFFDSDKLLTGQWDRHVNNHCVWCVHEGLRSNVNPLNFSCPILDPIYFFIYTQ